MVRSQIMTWVVAAVLALPGGAASAEGSGGLVQSELEKIVRSGQIPKDLQIVYDDMHGFHGGTTVVVEGNGKARRTDTVEGESRVAIGTLTNEAMLALVRQLVELKASEQITPERKSQMDESRARLTIRVGAASVTVWEWFNDLEKNARISLVKARLEELVPQKEAP